MLAPLIYQITLVNEHQIKVIMIGGESYLVELKNIYVTQWPTKNQSLKGLILKIKLDGKDVYMIMKTAAVVE